MPAGFQTRIAETVTTDFRNFKLVESIDFVDTDDTHYRMPVGAPSDLASIPRVFWDLLPPFGEYALEAYLHDGAYQNWLLAWDEAQQSWRKASLTRAQSDALFDRAMALNPNISPEQRVFLFRAVAECGEHAFNEDRS